MSVSLQRLGPAPVLYLEPHLGEPEEVDSHSQAEHSVSGEEEPGYIQETAPSSVPLDDETQQPHEDETSAPPSAPLQEPEECKACEDVEPALSEKDLIDALYEAFDKMRIEDFQELLNSKEFENSPLYRQTVDRLARQACASYKNPFVLAIIKSGLPLTESTRKTVFSRMSAYEEIKLVLDFDQNLSQEELEILLFYCYLLDKESELQNILDLQREVIERLLQILDVKQTTSEAFEKALFKNLSSSEFQDRIKIIEGLIEQVEFNQGVQDRFNEELSKLCFKKSKDGYRITSNKYTDILEMLIKNKKWTFPAKMRGNFLFGLVNHLSTQSFMRILRKAKWSYYQKDVDRAVNSLIKRDRHIEADLIKELSLITEDPPEESKCVIC